MHHSRSYDDFKTMIGELHVPGSRWQGGGYMDPSGAVLPMEMAGVDRLDSDLRYTPDNCRILFGPLNSLKKDQLVDTCLWDYLQQIRTGSGSSEALNSGLWSLDDYDWSEEDECRHISIIFTSK
ncbi:unnamed protein product [Sympodiomycopsis kandeliae]